MAAFALVDTDVFVGGLDASCFSNKAAFNVEVADLDVTTFCSAGWRQVIGGIKSVTVDLEGPQDLAFAAASAVSGPDQAYAVLGQGVSYVIQAAPVGGTEGDVAYGTQAVFTKYVPLDGTVGDVAMHKASFTGCCPVVRGVQATLATITTTSNGTGHQLGAVSATQSIYGGLNILTAAGTTPTLDVIIQSDDNAGFTTPTTRATFTQMTAKGGQWVSAIGAFTDTYWRLSFTVGGTGGPSFQVRGFLGIA